MRSAALTEVNGGSAEQVNAVRDTLGALERFVPKTGLRHVDIKKIDIEGGARHAPPSSNSAGYATLGSDYVVLSSGLDPVAIPRVLSHELGHQFLHHGERAEHIRKWFDEAHKSDVERQDPETRKTFVYFSGECGEAAAEALSYALVPPRANEDDAFIRTFPATCELARRLVGDAVAMDEKECYGEEIEGWAQMGLQPRRRYKVSDDASARDGGMGGHAAKKGGEAGGFRVALNMPTYTGAWKGPGAVSKDAGSGAWKDEPRKPKGSEGGGEWTSGGGLPGSSAQEHGKRDATSKSGVPKDMTDEDKRVLAYYHVNGYVPINAFVRNPDAYKESKYRPEIEQNLRRMDAVMAKSVLSKPMTVYRGLSVDPESLSKLDIGGTAKLGGFQSAAWSDGSARAFSYNPHTKEHGALLEMRLPAGAHAIDLDKTLPTSHEHEVIVDRGQTWKLVGKRREGKLPVYVLEMAAPPKAGDHVEGYSEHATWTADGRIHTTKIDDAVKALYEKKRVVLDQPRQVSTLIEKLGKLAKKAKELGEKVPEFNLCDVSVPGTNLFCAETKGIPRPKMPQIKDQDDFFKFLAKHGISAEKAKEDPAYLRATQTELDGIKVARMMREYEKDRKQKRVLVSSDNYILDGHHHWAGMIGVAAEDNEIKGEKLRVVRLSAPITELLEYAEKYGAPHSANTYGADTALVSMERSAEDFDPNEPRDRIGRWTSGGGAGGSEFVSPNVEENETLDQAIGNLNSERMRNLIGASHAIDRLFRAKEQDISTGIGAWADGAEETTVQRLDPSVDYDLGAAVTAAKALVAHQKAALWFEPGEGKNALYEFEATGKDIKRLHTALLGDGVQFHTLVPGDGKTTVYVYDEDGSGLDAVKKAAKTLGVSNVKRRMGRGEFIGSWDSREEGAKEYQRRIDRWIGSDRDRREGWRRLLLRWGNAGGSPAAAAVAADRKKSDPEHTLTLGLSGDMVGGWVRFFREIMRRASGGHSFSLEADREDGDDGGIRTGIDGDGADRIVSITLDGEDVTDGPAEDTAVVVMDAGFDPSEPRDKSGKWSTGGTSQYAGTFYYEGKTRDIPSQVDHTGTLSDHAMGWLSSYQWGMEGFESSKVLNPLPSDDVIRELSRYRTKSPVALYRAESEESDGGKEIESWSRYRDPAQIIAEANPGMRVVTRVFNPDEIIVDTTRMPKRFLDTNDVGTQAEVIVAKGNFLSHLKQLRSENDNKTTNTATATVSMDYDPNEPRVPAGQTGGGEWTSGGAGSGSAPEKPKHHEKLVNVGGDPWNQETAKRLADEQAKSTAELDKIASKGANAGEHVEVPSGEEEEEDTSYTPESWDELSGDVQQQVEDKWKEDAFSDFKNSEEESWMESDGPVEIATRDVAEQFNDDIDDEKNDWARDALKEFREGWDEDGGAHIPFSDDDLLAALAIDVDSGDMEFSDMALDRSTPDTRIEGEETLPGITLPPPHELLTDKMRSAIIGALKQPFDDAVDKAKDDLDPSDYVDDSMVSEQMNEYWDSMADSDKFDKAKDYGLVESEEIEAEGYEKPESGGPVKLPEKWDPLNETSGEDYRRTQRMAHYLFQKRAEQLFKERGIKADPSDIKRVDNTSWSGWKESSTSDQGKLLQLAIAEELGGRLNLKRIGTSREALLASSGYRIKDIGGLDGMKALVRAKWEVTQYMLDKAGIHDLNLYRGISMPGSGNLDKTVSEKGFKSLPGLKLDRNGAASFTTDRNVANGWGGGSGAKVTIRAKVPRTAVISVPAYGVNIHSEHEVVVAGTAWKGWDVWKGSAPDFDEVDCCDREAASVESETEEKKAETGALPGSPANLAMNAAYNHGFHALPKDGGMYQFEDDTGAVLGVGPGGDWNLTLKSGKYFHGKDHEDLDAQLKKLNAESEPTPSESTAKTAIENGFYVTGLPGSGQYATPSGVTLKIEPNGEWKMKGKHFEVGGNSASSLLDDIQTHPKVIAEMAASSSKSEKDKQFDVDQSWGHAANNGYAYTGSKDGGAVDLFEGSDGGKLEIHPNGDWVLTTGAGNYYEGAGSTTLKMAFSQENAKGGGKTATVSMGPQNEEGKVGVVASQNGFTGGAGDPEHGWDYEHKASGAKLHVNDDGAWKLKMPSGTAKFGADADELKAFLSVADNFKKAA